MRTGTILLLLPVLLIASIVPRAGAAISREEVDEAIKRGVAYLQREQSARGAWPERHSYPNATTCLCALAMLSAGVPTDDASIQKALSYIRKVDLDQSSKTYTVSLQTMVLCNAEPEKDFLLISKNIRWLEQTQLKAGVGNGSWSYPGRHGDNSNSQFAILALYEADRVGVKVKEQTWKRAYDYWTRVQNADSSWGYQPGNAGTGSMTCAGIASLVITSGKVTEGDARVVDGEAQCCGDQSDNRRLENALAWLGRHFSVTRNPGAGRLPQFWLYYYLYGLERVGRMTNRRFIGKHDWYREGAEYLIGKQDKLSGFWKGPQVPEKDPIIGTSLALLFLSKGRRPVVVAKMEFGQGQVWNRHRRDLATLVRHTEKLWGRDLTWQIVRKGATVEDLLETPVLYIAGSEAPRLNDEEVEALRGFIDRGGFIFADACCGEAFDEGFRELMKRVFDEPEYGLRPIPPEHPVYRAEELVDLKYAHVLEYIEYGCRTCVIYAPPQPAGRGLKSLSCYWELDARARDERYPKLLEEKIEAAKAVGVNVLTYATGREPNYKDPQRIVVKEESTKVRDERAMLYIAKLKHPGGCNAAPGALLNLLRVGENELKLRVGIEDRLIPITDEALFRHHLVFMHGRHKFQLTEPERKQLATFLERGGTLFADAICSSREFTESFRSEIKEVLKHVGEDVEISPLERIPVEHPFFSDAFGGYDLQRVKRRDPGRRGTRQPIRAAEREVEPDLEGIRIGERYGVIFSPYDISCALEQHVALECEGYIRADAARIGLNVILYSLHR